MSKLNKYITKFVKRWVHFIHDANVEWANTHRTHKTNKKESTTFMRLNEVIFQCIPPIQRTYNDGARLESDRLNSNEIGLEPTNQKKMHSEQKSCFQVTLLRNRVYLFCLMSEMALIYMYLSTWICFMILRGVSDSREFQENREKWTEKSVYGVYHKIQNGHRKTQANRVHKNLKYQ